MKEEKEISTADMLIKTIFGISEDAKDLTPMDKGECKRLMIEFAKLHVKAALEEAAEKAECYQDHYDELHVASLSILNAYPESNIK